MKKYVSNTLLLLFILIPNVVLAQAQVPEATEIYKDLEMVTPGEGTLPPSDAIILFDGTNLDAWESSNDGGEWRSYCRSGEWLY